MDFDVQRLTVDDDILTPDEYRMFVADHAIKLHGGMNPDFFKGTAIESYADKVLSSPES